MKFLILLSSFLISISAYSYDQFCSLKITQDNTNNYKYDLTNNSPCDNINDCWILISAPEDLIKISFDEQAKIDLSKSKYLRNEVYLLPIQNKPFKQISVEAFDINQKLQFPQELCIKIGSYEQLRWHSAFMWFIKTGVALYSCYFLAIFSIFLIFSLWIRQSEIGFSILAYSIISIVYLISFSEYPRAFLNPILSSGGYHFPLRLIQDAMLVLVFYHFYKQNDKYNFITRVIWSYIAVIVTYFIMIILGINEYIYFERLIKITAPLVAAPMAICTYFSFRTKDKTEKYIMLPISLILLTFQINDLLTFWGIIEGYYTVKFYIPFIVGLCFFLYLRRINKQSQLYVLNQERSKLYDEFIHDIRSPISVLRFFTTRLDADKEQKKIIKHALNRIENMINYLGSSENYEQGQIVPLTSVIRLSVKEKRIEHPNINISFDSKREFFTLGNRYNFQRIFSNLFNNAYEAYTKDKDSHRIIIEEIIDERFILIRLRDFGEGINSEILSKLFNGKISSKTNGSGIGLSSAKTYLNLINGDLKVYSKLGEGTTIELKIPLIKEPEWYLSVLKSNNLIFKNPSTFEDLKLLMMNADRDYVYKCSFEVSFPELKEIIDLNKNKKNQTYINSNIELTHEIQELLVQSNNVIIVNSLDLNEVRNEDLDLVLIDDDRYIRLAWEYSYRDTNKNIATFENPTAFLNIHSTFNKNVKIYIDLNINGEKTWDQIEIISSLGFKNLYLATGEDIDLESLPPSIIGIASKLPPN